MGGSGSEGPGPGGTSSGGRGELKAHGTPYQHARRTFFRWSRDKTRSSYFTPEVDTLKSVHCGKVNTSFVEILFGTGELGLWEW